MHFSAPPTTFSLNHYPEVTLIGPDHQLSLDSHKHSLLNIWNRIVLHLSTQWDVPVNIVKEHVPKVVQQYSQVQIADGDTISSALGYQGSEANQQDATFFQYELLVDKFAHHPCRQPEFEPITFFGQLQHALTVTIQPSPNLPDVDSTHGTTYIMLDVVPCKTKQDHYGFYEYSETSTEAPCIIDGTAVRAVVGRIKDGGKWVIVK
ncbi:hypothetical protein FRB94_014800 [Tulasnella sp. JGI-2019a]|nr:hypothetical protein FRB93_011476 [Tulasnella sp. JGI-2019a]KAG8988945.1 hypothetical protein FRB94_014800 [Tulasnella sp. JGI-2019a]